MLATHSRHGQRGFSLAEITTAIAVFAIIFVAALMLYDRSNRVFSMSAQNADMQQATRVAYEKLLQDIRLAGFDYKRAGVPTSAYPTWKANQTYVVGQMILASPNNGYIYQCSIGGTSAATAPGTWATTISNTTTESTGVQWTNAGLLAAAFDQPDEQVEYAWHSAITVRANYNYDLPNDSKHYDHGRESQLESTKFPVVTTGNDEIVTYALVSTAPGAANTDTISFYADVNSSGTPTRRAYPGGTAERQIQITGVDLSNANPPYTLYRFTLAENGSVVRTPLAENIRSLTFQYWEDQKAIAPLVDLGATPAAITDVGGDGQVDPGDSTTLNATGRRIRGKIRAVTVNLIGMSPNADNDYTDAADAVAPHYRKMALATTIVPRNLGIRTLPQAATQAPPPPVNVSACFGYCGIAIINWTPGDPSTLSSTGSTGDETFAIVWDNSATGDFTHWMPAGQLSTYAADLTQQDLTQDFYFKVAATNSVGTSFSDAVGPISLKNQTTPHAPIITAVGSIVSAVPRITLTWHADSTQNDGGSPSCTTGSPTAVNNPTEIKGYRLYRSIGSATHNAADLLLDVGSPGPVSDGAGNWTYVDTSITMCTHYYYSLQVVEWCTDSSQNSGGASGYSPFATFNDISVTTQPPAQPTGLNFDATSQCNFFTNACTPVKLTWVKVTQDTTTPTPYTINIDKYDIYRQKRKWSPSTGAYSTLTSFQKVAAITGQTSTPTPISWSEPTSGTDLAGVSHPLPDHDTTDNGPYFYDYYVIAKSDCGDSVASAQATFPNTCNSGVGVTATSAYSGSGTAANPWVGPTSINLSAGANPITAAWVSVDGAAFTAMASPWNYTYTDNYNGQAHQLIFTVQVGGSANCVQTLATVYYTESTIGCHLTQGASSVISTYSLPTGYMSNYYDAGFTITIHNLIPTSSITVAQVQMAVTVPVKNKVGGSSGSTETTGIMWQSQTPYSSTNPAGGSNPSPCPGSYSTTAQPCSLTFSPPAADATIAASSSKTFVILFNHKGQSASNPTSAAITSVSVTYKQNNTGTNFTCPIVP